MPLPRRRGGRTARRTHLEVREPGATSTTSSCVRRASRRRPRWPPCARPTGATGPATPTASRTATSCAASTASSPSPPDVVACPADEADVVALLDWCAGAGVAAVPYGGGSSVVGGVEAGLAGDRTAGVVSIDLTRLDRVLEIDRASAGRRASRAGLSGRCSRTSCDRTATRCATSRSRSSSRPSADGWRPARAATTPPCTPTSTTSWSRCGSSRRPASSSRGGCPARAPGPSPDRLFLGSEGTLGVITEAWMRVQDRPRFKASAGVRFADFAAGVAGDARRRPVRRCSPPTAGCSTAARRRCRPGRTDVGALLVLGFESADHPVDAVDRAGGRAVPRPRRRRCPTASSASDAGDARRRRGRPAKGAVGAWRNSFLRAPYTRDALVAHGRHRRDVRDGVHVGPLPRPPRRRHRRRSSDALPRGLRRRLGHLPVHPRLPRRAARRTSACSRPGRFGVELAMWAEIKAAAAEAVLAHGGTITHHHAVGRDHDRWYDQQRPDLFAAAPWCRQGQLDPAGVMNPGVLIDQ